jgi:hypothetical protein
MAETVHVIRRPYTALAIILALGLAVAACDFGPPPPPAPPVAAAEPEPAPTLPSPPPRKPAPARSPVVANLPPEASGERTSLPEERALEPAPEVTPATQAGSFDRLIGLDQPHVTDLLGDPRSRAESPPATIWRYAGRNCELDVYFYLDLQSQTMRALHYEVRSHDSPERSAQRCYGDVVQRRAQTESAGGTDRPR